MKRDFEYREIPYNYTSLSDREIILKYFDEETWDILNTLRSRRVTGRSAKLLFDVIGDIFVIDRNPYIYNDFLENRHKLHYLKKLHKRRLATIQRAGNVELVETLISKTQSIADSFYRSFERENRLRKRITRVLKGITSRDNIHFDAFNKVSHVTDATDWRVEYPRVVVYPDDVSEIPGLIRAGRELGLSIIPRGGGTGLTGGAVPVNRETMVINTEKLRTIHEIETRTVNGREIPIIELDAGVITEGAMEYCHERGYIFATDPTSAWASTIGGNIAENCGGKKCVIWGTAIDNLYSYRLVTPDGSLLEIIRRDHPHRKILPEDNVLFDIYHIKKEERSHTKTIELTGDNIRKPGVGKDITNKALGGLPGIQKEGGDGIIISGTFVLYTPFKHRNTLCLEFFGSTMTNASRAIIEILNYFKGETGCYLTALEHFDDKYVNAIRYRNKSERAENPKAVLLIDVEGNDDGLLNDASNRVIEMVHPHNTEGFIAVDAETQAAFWKDRKNLGAIARHTNAFKLNEDVVIPIDSLPEFADFIDHLNIKKELSNNIACIEQARLYMKRYDRTGDGFIQGKIDSFLRRGEELEKRYRRYMDNLDLPASLVLDAGSEATIFENIREGDIPVDIRKDLIKDFEKYFHGYEDLISGFHEVVEDVISRKIIIATHMHAGDGNIHVNIPVHSNDYAMLQEADETAGIVMHKTVELGGVISGEHGIGLTKLRFIDQQTLDRYAEYKEEADPDDIFNPGKLRSDFPLHMVYTPSMNLLKMEAFILEAADLKDLTISISACVRCGKCKEVCNTHFPGGDMYYNPRNKILGVSLITEAVLYESQTSESLSFRNFRMLREISNHCTMCHQCYTPCPVKIDFGEVTLDVRELLVERKRSSPKLITDLTLFFLKKRGYYINKAFRILMLRGAFSAQRLAYYLNKPIRSMTERFLPFVGNMLKGRMARSGQKSVREILHFKETNTFYAISDPNQEIKKSVIYFPGCGSERMFPDISFATLAILFRAGIRVVLPPEYLCCGYPLLANGKVKDAEIKSFENRVIFHRMAETIGYMDIHNVIVTCGTCYEMLGKYQIENIFQNSGITDLSTFIARENLYHKNQSDKNLIYHDPCHSPLKDYGYRKAFNRILDNDPAITPNCCGEGGTLALSTPGISVSLRARKASLIEDGMQEVITTCPSCVQGLSKIEDINGTHLSQYLARTFLGDSWKKDYLRDAKRKEAVERIIF